MNAPAMRPAELLGVLLAGGVEFVLIGGLAGNLHGTTRLTQDIDLAYATYRENVERLCAVVNRYQPSVASIGSAPTASEITPALLKRDRVVHLVTTLGRVDLLASVDGFHSFAAVKKMSEMVAIPRVGDVPVLSIQGLLKAKRAVSRPKDQQDIVELEAIALARRIEADPTEHP